jgi:alpha/beta superfamily hydrolase
MSSHGVPTATTATNSAATGTRRAGTAGTDAGPAGNTLNGVTRISANSVLPARRFPVSMLTDDGIRLVGEWSLPLDDDPGTVIVWCHPLPTHGGSMDSHVIRKTAWRLPALTGIGVLRFNTRGTTSTAGTSEGAFEANQGEGHDLRAALDEVVGNGMPDPWVVGWSFGTDVILRWGNTDPVAGAVLLSPPGRWTDHTDVATWAASGRPLTALVPEHDEFASPDEVRRRFAGVPQASILDVPGAKHLWVGETHARIAIDGIVQAVQPGAGPLPTVFGGPMERWDDVPRFARMDREA